MKKLRITGLVHLALLCVASGLAAQETTNFDRILVTLTEDRCIDADQGRLTSDSLVIRTDGDRLSYARNELVSLSRYKGTRAGTGFLAGSLIGLGLGLILSIDLDRDEYAPERSVMERSDRATYIFLGAAGGGLIGVLIGESSKRWEQVPLYPGFGIGENGSARLSLTFRF